MEISCFRPKLGERVGTVSRDIFIILTRSDNSHDDMSRLKILNIDYHDIVFLCQNKTIY